MLYHNEIVSVLGDGYASYLYLIVIHCIQHTMLHMCQFFRLEKTFIWAGAERVHNKETRKQRPDVTLGV